MPIATKPVILYKAESGVTFTATDPTASATGTSTSTVTVSAGNASGASGDSTIIGAATGTLNNPHTVTIILKDTWQNSKSNISAANIIVSATGTPSITQPSSNTDANGQTTADLTWASTGSKTVSVQISGITLVQNDGTTPDAGGFLDDTLLVTIDMPAADGRIRGGAIIRGGTTF